MQITVQLTSHSDPSRGETERLAEIFPVEFKRNGTVRDQFLRDVAESIKALAKAHNQRFKAEHPA
jgi:hypothetical protein